MRCWFEVQIKGDNCHEPDLKSTHSCILVPLALIFVLDMFNRSTGVMFIILMSVQGFGVNVDFLVSNVLDMILTQLNNSLSKL